MINKQTLIHIFGEIKVILIGISIALLLRMFLFEPFNIPSGSMYPNLFVGDYILVSKSSYGYSKYSVIGSPDLFDGRLLGETPKRGDVAVFRNPHQSDIDYVKRVIGLPNDRIQMLGGRLFINGKIVDRTPIDSFDYELQDGRRITVPHYIETLPNGRSHRIIEMAGDNGRLDNTNEYIVPEAHYFMMGDNRDNSVDSRVGNAVGFVPYDHFIGVANWIFMSYDYTVNWYNPISWFSGARAARFFTSIK